MSDWMPRISGSFTTSGVTDSGGNGEVSPGMFGPASPDLPVFSSSIEEDTVLPPTPPSGSYLRTPSPRLSINPWLNLQFPQTTEPRALFQIPPPWPLPPGSLPLIPHIGWDMCVTEKQDLLGSVVKASANQQFPMSAPDLLKWVEVYRKEFPEAGNAFQTTSTVRQCMQVLVRMYPDLFCAEQREARKWWFYYNGPA
jgi:hypothetical protein